MNNIFASQSVGYRHAFPLLAITSASLLATDIYLPSLPILPEALVLLCHKCSINIT